MRGEERRGEEWRGEERGGEVRRGEERCTALFYDTQSTELNFEMGRYPSALKNTHN